MKSKRGEEVELIMFSIQELGLDYYIPVHLQQEYKKVANSTLKLEEKIVNLLTINPGFMAKSLSTSEEEKYKKFKYESSVNLIKSKIDKKRKLNFFSLSYNVKPHIKEITNGLIYPDASELITLIHLNFVFKFINEIYPPGATLRIGSQFNYFRKFNDVTTEEAIQMNDMVLNFNRIAQKMVGSKEYVKIFDVYQEVEPYKKEFFLKVENAKYKILQEDIDMISIKKGAEYYLNYVIDETHFPNKEAAWNFCMYHTLDSAAYKSAIFSMFDTPSGLFKGFSEAVQVETRFQSGSNHTENEKSVYISFLPGASTFSYNRLTLKREDELWEQVTYDQIIDSNRKEYFVKELRHPFFFKERITNGKSI